MDITKSWAASPPVYIYGRHLSTVLTSRNIVIGIGTSSGVRATLIRQQQPIAVAVAASWRMLL